MPPPRPLLAVACLAAGAAALTAATPGARADVRRWQFAVDLELGARWTSNVEDWETDPNLHQSVGTIDLRGIAGPSIVGLAAALDVELGFEVPGAFVYAFHLSPVGLGVRMGKRSYLGVTGGVGFGGSTDRVGIAWELPVTGFLEFDVGRYVRARAGARLTFTRGDASRRDGSPTVDFADEVEASFGLAIGKRNTYNRSFWSDGTYVGAFAREQLGARLVGVVVSVAINGAGQN